MKTVLLIFIAGLTATTVHAQCSPPGKRIPHEKDCNLFSVCTATGTYQAAACPQNQHFLAVISNCISAVGRECSEGKSVPKPVPCFLKCGSNQQCEVVGGIAKCNCKSGFGGTPCQDINECAFPNKCQGLCTNTLGSFTCSCREGQVLKEDGFSCVLATPAGGGTSTSTSTTSLCARIRCTEANTLTCIEPDGKPQCICKPGFKGFICETKTFSDSCSLKCYNKGECKLVGSKASCQCKPGYVGTRCEIEVNACSTKKCGHGVCQLHPILKTASCKCTDGYMGDACDKVNPCSSYKCVNGKCTVDKSNNMAKCECTTGWKGDSCEEESPCKHIQCQNKGECNEVTGQCKCPDGWKGTVCTTKVTCEGHTCYNGGTCVIEENDAVCKCLDGVSGERCEIKKGCGLNNFPCQNGAKCIDSEVGFKCICTYQYSGATCKDKIKCADGVLKCQNGAPCVDGLLPTCKCKSGFAGKTCAAVDDGCGGCLNGGKCLTTPIQAFGAQKASIAKDLRCACPPGFYGTTCDIVESSRKIPCPEYVGSVNRDTYMMHRDDKDREWVYVCQKGLLHHTKACVGGFFDASLRRCITKDEEATFNAAYTKFFLEAQVTK